MKWSRRNGDGVWLPRKVTTCPQRVPQHPGAEPWAVQETLLAPGPAVPIRTGREKSPYL